MTKVDSTRVMDSATTKVRVSDSTGIDHEVDDTAVGMSGSTAGVTLNDGDLDTGVVTAKVGNVTLTVSKSKDGRTHIECKSDSLTLVIRNREKTIVYLNRRYDSLVNMRAVFHHSVSDSVTSATTTTIKPTVLGFLLKLWPVWVIVIIIAIVLFIIKRL